VKFDLSAQPVWLCYLAQEATMGARSPYRIELSDEKRQVLERVARTCTAPYPDVARAKIVPLAAEDLTNVQIAAGSTRRRWRSSGAMDA
jgi:hypothetical protein